MSGRAQCMIRHQLVYRRECFLAGLRAAGYDLAASQIGTPKPDDVLVIWNRYGDFNAEANRFERCGARVIVCENGYLGRKWRDGEWFALAVGHHAGRGQWPDRGPQRWDSWNVELEPWRQVEGEPLILAQRGIGEPGIASPDHWAEKMQRRLGCGRIRAHPGKDEPEVPLEDDLRTASCVITWASSAALKALTLGVPVFYEMRGWIGAQACRHVDEFADGPKRSDIDRLAMFQWLAWTTWGMAEVSSGEAFRSLLC